MLLWLARILAFIPLTILYPTFIKNRKNRPKGKAILACNHRSNWDIVLYYLHTCEKIRILAKKQLFKNKLLGWFLKNIGGLPIDRDASDINAIKECFKTLKQNKKLFIFPEGTRLKDSDKILGEIKPGLSLIAIKSKTPIVPIWIEKKPRLFRKSVYHVGEPFELSQFYNVKLDDEVLAKANAIVREKMLEVRNSYLGKRAKIKKEAN